MQKKWLKTMCKVLDAYLKLVFPIKDTDWDAARGFIKVVVTVSGSFKDEVRNALWDITTKWESKQNENIKNV